MGEELLGRKILSKNKMTEGKKGAGIGWGRN